MTELDEHGQPHEFFNRGWNRRKAARNLVGLLNGLVADRRLDERELVFLTTWLRDQVYLRTDPDAIDLLDCVDDILADGVVTSDELADLRQLIDDILEYRDLSAERLKDSVNRLLGMVSGALANQRLHDLEIVHLGQWLESERGGEVAATWPGNIIYRRIVDILADGHVDEVERADLFDTLQRLVGLADDGIVSGMATRLPTTGIDRVEFAGREFCFTGRFFYGTRDRCTQAVVSQGGVVSASVRASLDYLVVGGCSSRDWAHSSFGRKIERAIELQESGRPIVIVEEESWAVHLLADGMAGLGRPGAILRTYPMSSR